MEVNFDLLNDTTEELEEYEIKFDPILDMNYRLYGFSVSSEIELYAPTTDTNPEIKITYDEEYERYMPEEYSWWIEKNRNSKLTSAAPIPGKLFLDYLEKFWQLNCDSLSTYATLVQEVFVLNQFALSLVMYNRDVLQYPKYQFRHQIYFPNTVFLLVRHLPEARKFFQSMIRRVYHTVKRAYASMVSLFENSIYTDREDILTAILYTFLSTSLKEIEPLKIINFKIYIYF